VEDAHGVAVLDGIDYLQEDLLDQVVVPDILIKTSAQSEREGPSG
jgi:hypothetical protein